MQQRLDACMILHTLHNLLHLMQLHRLTAASCPPIVLSPELTAWHAFEHFVLAQNEQGRAESVLAAPVL
jgi:hypothetical protein